MFLKNDIRSAFFPDPVHANADVSAGAVTFPPLTGAFFVTRVFHTGILSAIGTAEDLFCTYFAKLRFKREEMKKNILTYVLSRAIVPVIVIGAMVFTIAGL